MEGTSSHLAQEMGGGQKLRSPWSGFWNPAPLPTPPPYSPIFQATSHLLFPNLSGKRLKPLCLCDVPPSSSDVIILQPAPHFLILKDPASNNTSSLKPFLMPLIRTSHSLFQNLAQTPWCPATEYTFLLSTGSTPLLRPRSRSTFFFFLSLENLEMPN